MSLKIYKGDFCFYGVAVINGRMFSVCDFSRSNVWPKMKQKIIRAFYH